MATVGQAPLHPSAYRFFDALRAYDVETAVAQLSEDATWSDPEGAVRGKEAIRKHLGDWLQDPEKRPSLTVSDARGDATRVHLELTVSGRMGRSPQPMTLTLLVVQGQVRQVFLRPRTPKAA